MYFHYILRLDMIAVLSYNDVKRLKTNDDILAGTKLVFHSYSLLWFRILNKYPIRVFSPLQCDV